MSDVTYWIALAALFVAVVALRKAYAVEGRLLPAAVQLGTPRAT